MLKHIFFLSFRAAFIMAIIFTLISFPFYGRVSFVFGCIAFLTAVFWCLLVSYPLVYLRKRLILSESYYFPVCFAVGFVLGCATPILAFRVSLSMFDLQAFYLFGFYGLCGALTATIAWDYVRRNKLTF
jgi:hypothetical protein